MKFSVAHVACVQRDGQEPNIPLLLHFNQLIFAFKQVGLVFLKFLGGRSKREVLEVTPRPDTLLTGSAILGFLAT